MNATMKNSLKSALILIAIAVVAVVALALANSLLPKYEPKLDLATVQVLNSMSPTGVNDQTALDEGYFVTPNVDIEAFNKDNGNSSDKVLAVYKAEKGDNAGTIFVETTTQGNEPGLRILTAFKDGVITNVTLRASSETPGYTEFAKIKSAVVGQSSVTAGMLEPVSSGATYSRGGFVKNFTLSFKIYNQIIGAGA